MALFGRQFVAVVALAALSTPGCAPEIGDSCRTTGDCTTGVDRICDATQPGGYCTVFNCEPGTCPEEAACVAYRSAPSATAECASEQQSARLQRTFCMRRCSTDADCRSDYACLNLDELPVEENPWAAEIIDERSVSVCTVPYSGPLPGDEREVEVCTAGPLPSGAAVSSEAGAAASSEAGAVVPADAAAVDGGG